MLVEGVEDAAGNGLAVDGVAGGDGEDPGDDLGAFGAFEEVAAGSGGHNVPAALCGGIGWKPGRLVVMLVR